MRGFNLLLKRSIDLFGSLFGVIIISPILLVISLIIKMTSSGPIFFLQERLGKDGRVFKIIKFRTMVVNAENIGDGLSVKDNNDKRITQIGKFLRASSLDELPQLFNVIKGDMSLVGPRPPVPYHPYKFNEYDNVNKIRFNMRPGITGLSQVTVRNSVPWVERIVYDVKYVKEFNIYLDLKILLLTLKKIVIKENIYANNNNSHQ
jgi:undecaprenyl phosphate N,N'-diacetylbacillosamine 1-phosphate transferase